MTIELSTAIPHDGGFILWSAALPAGVGLPSPSLVLRADRAFGSFWAFQTGWWNIVSTTIMTSLYPNMIHDYLNRMKNPGNNAGNMVEVRVRSHTPQLHLTAPLPPPYVAGKLRTAGDVCEPGGHPASGHHLRGAGHHHPLALHRACPPRTTEKRVRDRAAGR
jgi:hypothetical protein